MKKGNIEDEVRDQRTKKSSTTRTRHGQEKEHSQCKGRIMKEDMVEDNNNVVKKKRRH